MPKRNDIHSILLVGAGPIQIGQACEFDYSGTQACSALREEGYRIILCNSNPATIMTDPEYAHATYIEPVEWQTLERIIQREKPDAILPTVGGQTAINVTLDLIKHGVLEQYGVEMLGASPEVFHKAEDRGLFNQAMERIGLKTARSAIVTSMAEANAAIEQIGFPTIVRPSFTLGGSGSGIATNREEFTRIVERGLALSPTSQVLLDQSLLGWKEYELEVVRDSADNAIIVCSIENLDPMGIHTGDSITVAPAQTLTDKEYQLMRDAAIAVLREIGVDTGGSNVQFAVNPDNGDMVVIEMNPRVSRSSALASKATGFPIARVAAKLAIGYTLDELNNEITGDKIPVSFEPTLDYVVTKIPRFAFEKFPDSDTLLGTQMKSVGEVMALGGCFAESLQKALRGMETDLTSLRFHHSAINDEQLRAQLQSRDYHRLWYVCEAIRRGFDLTTIYLLSRIDMWFLYQLKTITDAEQLLSAAGFDELDRELLLHAKRLGFADSRIAELLSHDNVQISAAQIRKLRWDKKLHPVYKRVDSCAAEFASATNYLYSTYWGQESESAPGNKRKIVILGSGPNRIGQGIEFDYCCVHAAQALHQAGCESIMVNCNPETVSTDYDISDRLYFEPITLEDVLEITRVEQPEGVIVHFGGQTPLRIALDLEAAGVPIAGLAPSEIDRTEDREKFSQLVTKCNLRQPENATVRSEKEALDTAGRIGFPLMVRPSYVLGGRAMEVVYSLEELTHYLSSVVRLGPDNPVLLDRFLENAIEFDVDALSDGDRVVLCGIMQHIEQAGVHSGDSACRLPATITPQQVAEINTLAERIAGELKLQGLINLQLAIADGSMYIIEVNPRASRTIPYVSKATGVPFAKLAARAMIGEKLADMDINSMPVPALHAVKEVVFPWIKFPMVDPVLGPEMKSTGEVMGVGTTFDEAYLKALLGAGTRISNVPDTNGVLLSVRTSDKPAVGAIARVFADLKYPVYATSGTAAAIAAVDEDIPVTKLRKIDQGSNEIPDLILSGKITLIINTPRSLREHKDSTYIRQAALRRGVAIATTIECGQAIAEALRKQVDFDVYPIQSLRKP